MRTAAFRHLPPELWIQIALLLPIESYYALSHVSDELMLLLNDPINKKRWILNFMNGNFSDALVFAYRYQFKDVVQALLATPSTACSKLQRFSDAFLQITCHATSAERPEDQVHKLHILQTLLEDDQNWGKKNSEAPSTSSPIAPMQTNSRELAVIALRWCCHYAEDQIVEYLLDVYGLTLSSIKCYSSWWMRMLRLKKFRLIHILLKHRARVSISEDQFFNNTEAIEQQVIVSTPAHLSAESSLENENIDSIAVDGFLYLLRTMTYEDRWDAVQVLLDGIPEYKRSVTAFRTALYHIMLAAAMYNRLQLMQKLIDVYEIDLSQIDPEATTLWSACSHGHVQLMEFIVKQMLKLDRDAYPPKAAISQCFTTAVAQGHFDAMTYLFETAAPLLSFALDSDGQELVRLACKTGRVEVVRYLLQHITVDQTDASMASALSGIRLNDSPAKL